MLHALQTASTSIRIRASTVRIELRAGRAPPRFAVTHSTARRPSTHNVESRSIAQASAHSKSPRILPGAQASGAGIILRVILMASIERHADACTQRVARLVVAAAVAGAVHETRRQQDRAAHCPVGTTAVKTTTAWSNCQATARRLGIRLLDGPGASDCPEADLHKCISAKSTPRDAANRHLE